MKVKDKKITKLAGKASMGMLIGFDDGTDAIAHISDNGHITLSIQPGHTEWEPMIEAVYTSVDEVLILNS